MNIIKAPYHIAHGQVSNKNHGLTFSLCVFCAGKEREEENVPDFQYFFLQLYGRRR